MKNNLRVFLLVISIILGFNSLAMAQDTTKVKDKDVKKTQPFVDEDGDGYNDNAPDHDGDGIPNGLDPDWKKLKKGEGKGKRKRFVDLDGDGINDNIAPGKSVKEKDQNQLKGEKGSSINEADKTQKRKRRQAGKRESG